MTKKFILATVMILLLMFAVSLQLGFASEMQQSATVAPTTAPTVAPTTAPQTNTTTTNQTNTTTTQGSTASSSVQIFFVACGDVAIMNLSGTMLTGEDVYYQVFAGPGGTGTALTSLRQVSLNGAYTFSERIPYNTGTTVAAGSTASARVVIARETDSSRTSFETTVDDFQDGCNNAQNPLGTSIDAGSGAAPTPASTGSNILSPFGGVINSNLVVTPEPSVFIGARPLDNFRSSTPGLLFAECDQFQPQAKPGIIYDTDEIIIFWSWFAKTPELVQQHIDNAQYAVKLNTAPFNNVEVSPIQQRGRNYWVFYTARAGNLRPGGYGVEYRLTWSQPISDGYDNYGPGTTNRELYGTCTFRVSPNTGGVAVNHNPQFSVTTNRE